MDIWTACQTGNLSWFKEQKAAKKLDTISNSYGIIQATAQYGHLELLKWLVLDSGQHIDVTDADNAAIRYAAENGHLDIVRWLVEESGQPVDVTACENYAIRFAAANGHFDIIRWIVKESGQDVNATDGISCAVRWAALKGNLKIARWLIEDSGLSADCRDYENWKLSPYRDNDHTLKYLAHIALLQNSLGLTDWKEALETMKAFSQQPQSTPKFKI